MRGNLINRITQLICGSLVVLLIGAVSVFTQNNQNSVSVEPKPPVSTPSKPTEEIAKGIEGLRRDLEKTNNQIKELEKKIADLDQQKQELEYIKQTVNGKSFDERELSKLKGNLLKPDKAMQSFSKLIEQFGEVIPYYYDYDGMAQEAEFRILWKKFGDSIAAIRQKLDDNPAYQYYENPSDSSYVLTYENIDQYYGKPAFDAVKKESVDAITKFEKQLETNRNSKETELSNLQNRVRLIEESLSDEKANITTWAITLGLPLFSATVLFLYCIPFLERFYFIRKNCGLASASNIFDSGIVTEVVTIFLLVMTILILGLAKIIEGEVLGTLIGGISGYVLNRIISRRDHPRNPLDESGSNRRSGSSSEPATNPNAT